MFLEMWLCRFIKKLEHSWKALVHDGVRLLSVIYPWISLIQDFNIMLFENAMALWLFYPTFFLFSRTLCLFTGQASMQSDSSALCATQYLGKQVGLNIIFIHCHLSSFS